MKNVRTLAIAVLTLSTFAAHAADAVTTTTSTSKTSTTVDAPVKKTSVKKHVVATKQVTATPAKVDSTVSTSTTTVK